MIWTIKSVLQWTTEYFTKLGLDSPRVDAEILLAKALNCNRVKLYIDQDKPLSQDELAAMHKLVERRAAHEPVAYIFGSKGFMQDDFLVTPAVLIPRPETELLVEELGRLFKDEACEFLDIGTGSGVIVLSLLRLLPNAHAKAVDISSDALQVAMANADKLGLTDRVKFVKADVYSGLDSQKFDLIVSNPPYIPNDVIPTLDKDVQREPRLALAGGGDGLDFYRRIIAGASQHLSPDGVLAMEMGIGQSEAVAELCHQAGFAVTAVMKDYAGIDRHIFATVKGSKYADKILAINNGK